MSETTVDTEDPRINWRAVGGSVSAGLAVVGLGLWIGEFDRAVVATAVINVGTALAVLALLLLVERRLFRSVTQAARTVATEAARYETQDLKERLVRLEDLEDAQRSAREQRWTDATRSAAAIETEGLSHAVVASAFRDAFEQRLFSEDFCVRTSEDPDCPLLYMLAAVGGGQPWALFLDFEPFEWGETQEVGGQLVRLPAKGESTVMWIHDEDAASIASKLELGLERTNRPRHGFSLQFALKELQRSILIAHRARAAEADEPQRLSGSLRLLVNQHWAATSFGLESIDDRVAVELVPGGFDTGPWRDPQLKEVPGSAETIDGLDEALAFLRDRFNWLQPGEAQATERFFRRRNTE